MGDFNCIFSDQAKNEGPRYQREGMEAFRDFLFAGNFSDLGYRGSFYTWKRGSLRECLDRGIATRPWQEMFPNCEVRVLAPIASDRNPLCLTLHSGNSMRKKKRKFRFENMWLLESSCKELIHRIWKPFRNPDTMLSIMENIEEVSLALDKWNRAFFW